MGVPGSKAQGEFEGAGQAPEPRLRFMDAAGVEAEVLHPTLLMRVLRSSKRDLVWAACQVYNEWLAEICARDPTRLVGVPVVILDDPQRAVAEVQRNLKGVLIPLSTDPGTPPYRVLPGGRGDGPAGGLPHLPRRASHPPHLAAEGPGW